MKRIIFAAVIFCLAILALVGAPLIKADEFNKKTILTFSEAFEVPGVDAQILPAGTYVFKLVDSLTDRDIVQISNADETHVYTTILAIANHRLHPTDKTVLTFGSVAQANRKPSRPGFIRERLGARNSSTQSEGPWNWLRS